MQVASCSALEWQLPMLVLRYVTRKNYYFVVFVVVEIQKKMRKICICAISLELFDYENDFMLPPAGA